MGVVLRKGNCCVDGDSCEYLGAQGARLWVGYAGRKISFGVVGQRESVRLCYIIRSLIRSCQCMCSVHFVKLFEFSFSAVSRVGIPFVLSLPTRVITAIPAVPSKTATIFSGEIPTQQSNEALSSKKAARISADLSQWHLTNIVDMVLCRLKWDKKIAA